MGTYSSLKLGLRRRAREARHLYRFHRSRATNTGDVVAAARSVEQLLRELAGQNIRDLRVLDIGCGQMATQAQYFAQFNDVVGIDSEVVLRRFHASDYVEMWRVSGRMRVAKTLARKAAGIDHQMRIGLARTLDIPASRLRHPQILRMDAAAMEFPDASFDVVYSICVFEHLEEPEAVAQEVARVLRPGGVAYLHAHLYTADTGAHDPRLWLSDRGNLPYWAHLRPAYAEQVETNSYLNQWRLDRWRALFAAALPGSEFLLLPDPRPGLGEELARLRATGELNGYRDEELLTAGVAAVWRRPPGTDS
jgi:SAM-dependent methyltransferase